MATCLMVREERRLGDGAVLCRGRALWTFPITILVLDNSHLSVKLMSLFNVPCIQEVLGIVVRWVICVTEEYTHIYIPCPVETNSLSSLFSLSIHPLPLHQTYSTLFWNNTLDLIRHLLQLLACLIRRTQRLLLRDICLARKRCFPTSEIPVVEVPVPLYELRGEVDSVAPKQQVVCWCDGHGVAHECCRVECQGACHAARDATTLVRTASLLAAKCGCRCIWRVYGFCHKTTYISGSLLMSAIAAIGIPKLLAGPQKSALRRQRKLHFTFSLLFSLYFFSQTWLV